MAIGAANGVLPSVDSAAKPIVDEIRSHVEAACGEDGIDAVFCSLFGEPSTVLARLANRMNADLVIVGASRARTSRFFGSVGRNLVRNASWPVVVVP
jgi:nucleotide-binding universal stress UspA family protein